MEGLCSAADTSVAFGFVGSRLGRARGSGRRCTASNGCATREAPIAGRTRRTSFEQLRATLVELIDSAEYLPHGLRKSYAEAWAELEEQAISSKRPGALIAAARDPEAP